MDATWTVACACFLLSLTVPLTVKVVPSLPAAYCDGSILSHVTAAHVSYESSSEPPRAEVILSLRLVEYFAPIDDGSCGATPGAVHTSTGAMAA